MLLVDRVDDREFLCGLVTAMYDGLNGKGKKQNRGMIGFPVILF